MIVAHASTPRSIDKLVEEQVSRWLAEERRRKEERATPEPARPVVTLSRQAGASGTDVARLVAERLGFSLWDRELLRDAAAHVHASERLLDELDERDVNPVQDLLGGVLMGDALTEYAYVQQLLRSFSTIARQGGAVIVGRGAQFALESHPALRVRIVAAHDARVRAIAAARGLPERDARHEVERIDRERLAFVRRHFRRDAADPGAYDLVLNTTSLAPASAADVVVAAYRAKFR